MTREFMKNRRSFLQGSAMFVGAALSGAGTLMFRPSFATAAEPVKVGVALDMTGGLGAVGLAGINTAKMIVQEFNDAGGILGRPVELYIADTATNESIGVANVRTMIQRDKVDVVIGGLASSMRNAIKDVIIGRGKTLYLYPSLYEGKECTPYLFCTGATPAQQCDTFIPWLMENGGKRFALPSSDYIWPQVLNKYVRDVVEKHGGEVVYEEFFPFDQIDFSASVNKIMSENVNVVINSVIPPGGGALIKQLHQAGFTKNGGRFGSFYYDENALNFNTAEELEGLASCLDWFQSLAHTDPLSKTVFDKYNQLFPGPIQFTAGNSALSVYRGLKLWEAAVKEAGTLERDAVAAALDHAKVDVPGGAASMVPGKRHISMNMYIAVSKSGKFQIVSKSDGPINPKEC